MDTDAIGLIVLIMAVALIFISGSCSSGTERKTRQREPAGPLTFAFKPAR